MSVTRKRPLEDGQEEEIGGTPAEMTDGSSQYKRARVESSATGATLISSGSESDSDDCSSSSEEGEVSEGEDGVEAPSDRHPQAAAPSPETGDGAAAGVAVKESSPGVSSQSSSEPQSLGWNKGINTGQVRTTFTSFTPSLAFPPPAPKMEKPATPTSDVGKAEDPALPVIPNGVAATAATSKTPVYTNSNISLVLPPLPNPSCGPWGQRFEVWARKLTEANPAQIPMLPKDVVEAFRHLISREEPINNKKRKAAMAAAEKFRDTGRLDALLTRAEAGPPEAANAAQKSNGAPESGKEEVQPPDDAAVPMPTAEDWEGILPKEEMKPESAAPSPADLNGKSRNANSNSKSPDNDPLPTPATAAPVDPSWAKSLNIPVGDAEHWQQTKYFPGLSTCTDMCILCLRQGHRAMECHVVSQSLSCKNCGENNSHSLWACPAKQRCECCGYLGHSKPQCAQKNSRKVQRNPDESCAYCGGAHRDQACDMVWRTYHFDEHVDKVNSLVAYCASCGKKGHYVGDCPQNKQESQTWCLKNLERCWANKSKLAPIEKSTSGSTLRRPELEGIDNEHIFFDSDDDADDMDAWKAVADAAEGRVTTSTQLMNLSTNIQFEDHAPGYSARPPLPTGPPPPLPSTLPPRPGSFADPAPRTRGGGKQDKGRGGKQDKPRGGGKQDKGRGGQKHPLPARPANAGPLGPPGRGNYQNVPPPPGLHASESQGSASRNASAAGSRGGRGGKGGRGRGGRGGGGGGGNGANAGGNGNGNGNGGNRGNRGNRGGKR